MPCADLTEELRAALRRRRAEIAMRRAFRQGRRRTKRGCPLAELPPLTPVGLPMLPLPSGAGKADAHDP